MMVLFFLAVMFVVIMIWAYRHDQQCRIKESVFLEKHEHILSTLRCPKCGSVYGQNAAYEALHPPPAGGFIDPIDFPDPMVICPVCKKSAAYNQHLGQLLPSPILPEAETVAHTFVITELERLMALPLSTPDEVDKWYAECAGVQQVLMESPSYFDVPPTVFHFFSDADKRAGDKTYLAHQHQQIDAYLGLLRDRSVHL